MAIIGVYIAMSVVLCLAVAQEPNPKGDQTALLTKLVALEARLQETNNTLQSLQNKYNRRATLTKPYPNPHGEDHLTVPYLERDGWEMVFRASAGNGQTVYEAWTKGTGTSTTKPLDMARSYTTHFREANLDHSWTSLKIKHVKFALYKDNIETAYIIFNGVGSTITSWFDKTKILESSWSDLTPSATFNFFSVIGADDGRVLRRFFINQKYAGCAGDVGHFAVVEEKGVCAMDKHVRYPQFVYSDMNSADVWERSQFEHADYLAIYVHV
ncbi:hypothetical protein MAR_017115 [Mya arenaria]|uniref:Uncharacterized protein n=1 Tax=Mya arenaria TaxID=6604 RepID=A0ABY7EE00_MYAAR|nr:uncharacterized protein LOC128239015 [Mya arenaria]WAR07157.1 hypothetical protein MAR_017115 [Mya arenaria]